MKILRCDCYTKPTSLPDNLRHWVGCAEFFSLKTNKFIIYLFRVYGAQVAVPAKGSI